MQKFTAWLRRHKTKFLLLGILIGLTLLAWAFVNAPININRMEPGDWRDTHISKIGAVTVQKLEANGPYERMSDIDRVSGIGPVKMAQIRQHFTTWDTARSEVWYAGFFIGLALTFGCGLLLWRSWFKKRKNAQWLEKTINVRR